MNDSELDKVTYFVNLLDLLRTPDVKSNRVLTVYCFRKMVAMEHFHKARISCKGCCNLASARSNAVKMGIDKN